MTRGCVTIVVAMALGLSLVLLGCDEDNSGRGCTTDSDCRGERVCRVGQCEEPEYAENHRDTREDAGNTSTEDTGLKADTTPPGDDLGIPPADDTEPPSIDAPGDICQEARAYIDGCEELVFYEGELGLNWPECETERDICAANCLQDYTCGQLDCEFNPNIDCDGPGPFVTECLASCDEDPPDSACGTTFDCCAGRWLCFDVDDAPVTCDLDCQHEWPPPPCERNAAGLCAFGPEPGNLVCSAALEHLTQECGYIPEALQEDHPRDYALIAQMGEGACTDPYLTCYANCMAYPVEDVCFACRFIDQTCLRDPFDECISECMRPTDPARLCEVTGGVWDDSDCPHCCGPTPCGSQPHEPCPEACCGPQQCVCPDDRPFWSPDTGCFFAAACFP